MDTEKPNEVSEADEVPNESEQDLVSSAAQEPPPEVAADTAALKNEPAAESATGEIPADNVPAAAESATEDNSTHETGAPSTETNASENAKPADDAKTAEPTGAGDAPAEAKPAESGEPAAPEIKHHIIVVNDDAEFNEAARAYFEEKSFTVQAYASKEQLNEIQFEKPPALLVMDMDLNGEDGRSLALDLLDAGKLNNCVIVLLTDTAMDKQTIDFTLKLGFRKVLQKPVALDTLERILKDEPRRKAAMNARKSFSETSTAIPEKAADGEGGVPTTEEKPESAESTAAKTQAAEPAVKAGAGLPVLIAPSKPGKKTRTVDAAPERKSLNKGIVLGVLLSMIAAVALGLSVSSGYAHSYIILEGMLLGLAAGIGLGIGWKGKFAEINPMVAGVVTGAVSLAAWGALLAIRAIMDMPFVVRTEAMLAFSRANPDFVREWGTTESTAMGFIIGQLIVAYILAMFIVRGRLRASK